MKRKLILLLLCTLGLYDVSAQTQDVAKQISTIKRDTTYLYAEATMKDWDEAIVGAKSILEMKVGDWIRSQKTNEGVEVCIAKVKDHCFEVQTRRGEYYRAFVYVKKSDIMPVGDRNELVAFQVSSQEADRSSSNEAISEETLEESPGETNPAITLTPDEQQMKSITSFYDIEPYVKGLKGKGRLAAYGKYATLPANQDCYIFVYDKAGSVVAVLRRENGNQINLNTLGEDDIKKYKNCGAIWLQLK